jgi:hypothetical protein
MPYFLIDGTDRIAVGAIAPTYDELRLAWQADGFVVLDPTRSFQVQYEPDVESLPVLTPMTLYMAFTPAERIAIKASTDQMVIEFWAMYQLSVQLEKPTDPNLVSVQEALAYLAQPKDATPPGAGILASQDRVKQILAGIPQ